MCFARGAQHCGRGARAPHNNVENYVVGRQAAFQARASLAVTRHEQNEVPLRALMILIPRERFTRPATGALLIFAHFTQEMHFVLTSEAGREQKTINGSLAFS